MSDFWKAVIIISGISAVTTVAVALINRNKPANPIFGFNTNITPVEEADGVNEQEGVIPSPEAVS